MFSNLFAETRQHLRKIQEPVELESLAKRAPFCVVEILLGALSVETYGLDMTLRRLGNPDLFPGGRDGQRIYAGNDNLVDNHSAIHICIFKISLCVFVPHISLGLFLGIDIHKASLFAGGFGVVIEVLEVRGVHTCVTVAYGTM